MYDESPKPESSGKLVFWFLLLTFSSTSLILLNKGIMHEFKHPNTLLMVQNGLTVVFNVMGHKLGYFEMKEWKMEHFKIFVVPTILFTIMLFCSLKSLPYIAVATTIVFRNIGTVLVAFVEVLALSLVLSKQKLVAIGVIIIGSVIYAGSDINYDPTGYLWISANTILYALNMVYEKFAVMEVDQTPSGTSCYQNILSIPVCLVLMVVTNEFEGLVADFSSTTLVFKGLILFSGMLGCSLSICYMTLYGMTSATSISIAGNLNKLLSAIVGAVVFSNALTEHVVMGLLVCLGGGMLYSAKSDMYEFIINCVTDAKKGSPEDQAKADEEKRLLAEAQELELQEPAAEPPVASSKPAI